MNQHSQGSAMRRAGLDAAEWQYFNDQRAKGVPMSALSKMMGRSSAQLHAIEPLRLWWLQSVNIGDK